MSQTQRSRGWAYLALTGLVALGGVLASRGVVAGQGGRIGLDGEALAQPGLPIELSRVSVDSSIVTRETWLSYTVANRGTYPLEEVTLSVLVFGEHGNVRGGQTSSQNVSVEPGGKKKQELRLSNLLYVDSTEDYSRIVVAVEGWRDGKSRWRQSASFQDLLAAMNAGTALPAWQSSPVSLGSAQTAATCGEDFCNDCFAKAKEACGPKGIRSWKCILSTCHCEFSCKNGGVGEPLP